MKYKIVMVDDEPNIVDGFKVSILKKYQNIECVSFYNSIDTLKYIENNSCDILICDINMPVKNGIDLVMEVKKSNPNLQVIFLTGYSSFDYIYKATKIDDSSYLMKIEGDEELFKLIDKKIDIISKTKSQEELISKQNQKNIQLINEVTQLKYLELLKGNKNVFKKYELITRIVLFNINNDINYLTQLINNYFCNIDHIIISFDNLICLFIIDEFDFNSLNVLAQDIFATRKNETKIIYSFNRYDGIEIFEVYEKMKELLNNKYKDLISVIELESFDKNTNNELAKIEEYILKNLENNVSLNSVANHFHYNTSYFSRYFKSLSGETFKNYLFKLQIQQAKYYLKHTNMFINDIAKKVGFESVNNFTSIFKRYEKITPTEYKKESKN